MKNNNGECAIHLVGKRGDKELITMLLSNHHTDLQALDKNRRTPLHHACFHGNTITCETLLNQGADLEAQTIEGLTPLHVAIIGGQEEIVKLLIKRGGLCSLLRRFQVSTVSS
jgi:ankyrin repeat protein